MAREFLSDYEVEQEIERLSASPMVRLAKKEQRLLYKRRQTLYNLRSLEKRGKQLSKSGINIDNIETMLFGADDLED